jgi:SAM-dependent methyltransferase
MGKSNKIRKPFAGREMALSILKEHLINLLPLSPGLISVAVIGGTEYDEEIQLLRSLDILFKLEILNIAGDYTRYLDLSEIVSTDNQMYDIVFCSQVFEHLSNTDVAIKNIVNLTKPGGLFYINCPASNMKHEDEVSPFYSAGYSAAFFSKNIKNNADIIFCKSIGSERVYKQIHTFGFWPSMLEHDVPILRGLTSINVKTILNLIKYFARNVTPYVWSNKWQVNGQYSVETIVLARRIY